jgi:hypothetical protein
MKTFVSLGYGMPVGNNTVRERERERKRERERERERGSEKVVGKPSN